MNEAPRQQVEIYTDGGCEPNPGAGGYAAVLLHPRKRTEVSGGFRLSTNNRMEIFAAIAALELLKLPCTVTLHSDSQYLVNAIMKGWAVRYYPTYAVVDRKGFVRAVGLQPDRVESVVKKLLAESAP